jgi:DNA-binding CsgD family transcriptional regulator
VVSRDPSGRLRRTMDTQEPLAAVRGESVAGPPPTLAAGHQVAVATLQVGMALFALAAVSDLLFAVIDGATWTTVVEGAALASFGALGLLRPEIAAGLLRPRGRVLVPIGVFVAVGAVEFGLQMQYAEVAPAIVWVAVIVASRPWVALALALSIGGYLTDVAVQGHSLSWMLTGGGQVMVANQVVDLLANAGAALVLVGLLRRFIAGAPASIRAVRMGAPSLTAQLALAAGPRPAELPRADPLALTRELTAAERGVLVGLAAGRSAKQIAHELTVALSKVRSHIASAKRKTGARTIEQLVAIFSEASHEH